MELHIEKTQASPEIYFDADQRVLRISGESYPENSFDFYAPVLDWLGANLAALPSLRLEMSVSYMNSSSIKCMLDILDALGEAHASGKKVQRRVELRNGQPARAGPRRGVPLRGHLPVHRERNRRLRMEDQERRHPDVQNGRCRPGRARAALPGGGAGGAAGQLPQAPGEVPQGHAHQRLRTEPS